ncbi:zf-HC2 domain-containing protein [Amycolatopsis anabasis]|uniref:zf-HC2 domain-containing protein n=1 Tax=Amycolatopsis anabasis TaxID=1840409 RepID=UPI00131DF61F|nr:zf-HC2 domain-containing protein [Amycolatopsis anabasis]
MTEPRGWGLPESHLLPDAVVAFVDGELSLGAQDRASSHIARCPSCAAEVAAQRQARAAVKRAAAPPMSAGFLASLRSIPEHTELTTTPDNLAITQDGQLVAIQRPDRVAGLRDAGQLGGTAPLGTTAPLGNSALGNSPNVLGGGRFAGSARRRAAQGAGVVVSGLVLSALALVATSSGGTGEEPNTSPGGPPPGVLRAQLGGVPEAPAPTTTTTTPAPAGSFAPAARP